MAAQIIYHDFQGQTSSECPTTPSVVLNASVMKRGKRFFKNIETVNALLNSICYFLCGACAGFSIFVLLLLCVWF